MLLVWTQRAKDNRLNIMSYIAQFDVEAAQRISDNFKIARVKGNVIQILAIVDNAQDITKIVVDD